MEPEHLSVDGARLGRGRSWVVLGVVLAVVVGLVVLRAARRDPDVPPGPLPTPAVTSSAPSRAWPAGLPAGTLFVGSVGRVLTVDSRDGTVTPTPVEADADETVFTPFAGGVLVWRPGSRARAVVTTSGVARPVRGVVRTARSFLPGPDGAVWATASGRPEGSVWRRVGGDGRPSTSVTVEGVAQGDGAGGLLSVTNRGARPVYPVSGRPRQRGEVMATGPDGELRRTCAQAECRFTLHRRQERPDLGLSTAVGEDTTYGVLSPANRLLAVTETVGGTSTVRVSVVGTGQIDAIFDDPRGSTSDAVWLDDRWLALVSDGQLVLYDATEDRTVVPAVPLSKVGPLAWRPA